MKIAHVVPLTQKIPPTLYGGTERIVSYLIEEMVKDNDITLFASGDSKTSASLIPACERSLEKEKDHYLKIKSYMKQIDLIKEYANKFDIIHFHTDYRYFHILNEINTKHLTTLHWNLNIKDLDKYFESYNNIPLISISNSQRKYIPNANWIKTIYHGLPENLYKYNSGKGKYLAFLGRISPVKNVHIAIKAAIQSGIPIKIAAQIDNSQMDYYYNIFKPLLNESLVEYIGEINDNEKSEFLGNSIALLFPLEWDEPFGLVMIEAMACGTPVIAYRKGSVPEIILDGVNGYIADGYMSFLNSIKKIENINRQKCREIFTKNYTSQIMSDNYIKAYKRILEI